MHLAMCNTFIKFFSQIFESVANIDIKFSIVTSDLNLHLQQNNIIYCNLSILQLSTTLG